ncbi:PREDICTED: centrosome-associated protein CEP250-like [Chaetura pelagica]|uniref:centrosome-associated protein CEP250-like n=1 Tax=Chaetura pelagica TaxID=8897 RepID=UPI0005239619|nr:PREDICTED: centrosome-associated protein CEP250-like [Chaetura pelagica]
MCVMKELSGPGQPRRALHIPLKLTEPVPRGSQCIGVVSSQEESACRGLEQLHHESSHPGHTVAQESEEKDLLVHEKAILEKRLAAMEQDGQSLSEQLAEARSAKEALESSLLETQHRLSQLEMVKSDLEIQLHAVTQVKEVMEDMAQQLLRAEQQYENSLRLWETEHKVERNKLLQDLREQDRLQVLTEELIREIKLLQESVLASETQANAATEMNHCLEKELQDSLPLLKIKNEEVKTQWEKIQMLQKEAAQGKALQETLAHMSAILLDREEEIKLHQDQKRMLEKQTEMHKATLDQVTKDTYEKNHKMESQQEQIQQLEKLREKQSITVSKMSKDLEERDKDIRSQQEQIWELEKQGEMQRAAVSKKLKEKDLELMSLTQQIQELETERQQAKSLHTSLEHPRAELKDRERECDSQRRQLRLLQQYKEQQEGHLQEFNDNIVKMTLSLSKNDQELPSQEKQIQEAEEIMEMQLRTVIDQQEQTLETLKDKDRLEDIQKKQTSSYEEKTEEQMNALHRDLECTSALLKEKDLIIESQEKLIETFQKHEEDSKQQKKNLQHLQEVLQEKEQEILSLRKQCEACQEKEEMFLKQMNIFQSSEERRKVALTSHQKEVSLLQKMVMKRDEDMETLMQKLQCQEEELKTLQNLQLRLTENEEEELEEEIKGLGKDLQHVQQSLTMNDEEIKYQRERVRCLEETLTAREQELRKQSQLLKQITSALRWKDGTKTLQRQIQRLQKWEEEEAKKKKILQERDCSLQRQKELTQQLEAERRAKGEELESITVILKQTESREVQWKEKAEALALALANSEMANGALRAETAVLQSMVPERDTDRFPHQVERERRRLRRYCRGLSQPDTQTSLSDQNKVRTDSDLVGTGSGHIGNNGKAQWQQHQYRPKRS